MKRFDEDDKLENFLKENRPLHPRHSEREADKIWARIQSEKPDSFWSFQKAALGSFATVAALVTWFAVSPQVLNRQESPPPTAFVDEAAIVEESLDLEFLENGEIYEVTDLLSIAE